MGFLTGKALRHQWEYIHSTAKYPADVCGLGCIKAGTMVYTEYGLTPIESITPGTRVLSLDHQTGQLQLQASSGGFPKGVGKMFRVSSPQGGFEAVGHHRICSSRNANNVYRKLEKLEHNTPIQLPQINTLLLNNTNPNPNIAVINSAEYIITPPSDDALDEVYWDIQVLHNHNYITEDGTIHHNSGKTEALVYRALKFMTEIPKVELGIYQPTIDLTKRILYPRFEDIFANSGLHYRLNKTDGTMEVWMPKGKALITFRSMDNFSRIIGYQTHHALIDELDTMPKDKAEKVWMRVIARNRKRFTNPDGSEGVNTVGVTTTPEGKNFVYDMWVKKHADNPDYQLIKGRTTDNYHLPSDYVSSLRATYPPQLIAAYLDGEFVNLEGNTVYEGYDRDKNNTTAALSDYPESTMLHIGMDFNISRMSACICVKNDSNQLYVIDELHHLMDTPAMIQALSSKFGHYPITIYPDASGRSRKSVDASKSDIRLLRDAGFRINAPKKNPSVRERVVSVNALFLNAKGERNLFVNQKTCPNLVEQLEFQAYDDNGVPIKDGSEDPLDALGYCVNRVFGLAKASTKIGKMRIGV